MGSQRVWMLCFPYCKTQECKAFLPPLSLITYINHLKIFYLLSLRVSGIEPKNEIIRMANIE